MDLIIVLVTLFLLAITWRALAKKYPQSIFMKMWLRCFVRKFPYERKTSPMHGDGLFATRYIREGTVLIDWLKQDSTKIIDKDDYKQNTLTGIRLAGDLFIDGEADDTDFINHSDNPNLVHILGLVVSSRGIEEGEELTLDYRHLNAENELDVVQGVTSKQAVIEQSKTLRQILGHILRMDGEK